MPDSDQDPDPDKYDDMPNTDLPRRLLSAFHHRNPQSGEWHKQCHCATQTVELWDFNSRELLISHPVSRDWDDEEHFFRDLNWKDDAVSAHFAGYRWDRLLKLNSETWADAESFDFLENILPGRSQRSSFLPRRIRDFEDDAAYTLLHGKYEDDSDYSPPSPNGPKPPSSTGPTYLRRTRKAICG